MSFDGVTGSSSGRTRVGGLATGVDTASLVEGLLALDRAPLQRIRANRAEVEEQRGLMREFRGLLATLRDKARDIDNRNFLGTGASFDEELLRYKGSSEDEDIATATARNDATPGSFEVTVEQLASEGRQFSQEYDDDQAAAVLEAGQKLTITFPSADPDDEDAPTTITIEAGSTMGLAEVKAAINSNIDNDESIRAEIVRAGNGDTQRLVLTAGATGEENDFEVAIDDGDGDPASSTSVLAMDDDLRQEGQDSIFTIFGEMEVTRPTNFIDDAVSDVTFELRNVSEFKDPDDEAKGRKPITVTIELDVEGISTALQEMADAYNAVVDFINKQVEFDEATEASGPLGSDSTLRRVQGLLNQSITNNYKFRGDPNNRFARGEVGGGTLGVGLRLGDDGKMEIDRDVLEEALKSNASDFRMFFSGLPSGVEELEFDDDGYQLFDALDGDDKRFIAFKKDGDYFRKDEEGDLVPLDPEPVTLTARTFEPYDQGFASGLVEALNPLLAIGDGVLDTRERGYQTRLDTIDDSIERYEDRIASREETLTQRFTAMELIVSNLSSQAGFLSALR